MATSWFSRTGSNPIEPTDYTKLPGLPSCASGSNQICAILDNEVSGSRPELGTAIKNAMIQALDSRTSTATVKLKP